MKDQKKIRLFWVLGITGLILLLGSITWLGWHWITMPPKPVLPTTLVTSQTTSTSSQSSTNDESTLGHSELIQPEEDSTSNDSLAPDTGNGNAATEGVKEPNKPVNHDPEKPDVTSQLQKFLSVYFTWDLSEKSVDNRAKLLQELMSPTCYDEQAIAADSELLKELIQTYEKRKEINTSNSMQLVSSRYLAAEVYQATDEPNVYQVKVKLEQKAPYQKQGFMLHWSYQIHFEQGLVTQMARLNESYREEYRNESTQSK